MSDTDDWDGQERRKMDQAALDKAISEVRTLRPAVVGLAEALTAKTDVLHRVMVRMAILFAVLFIAQFISSGFWVNGLNKHMDKGHNKIICTLNLTPEQKAALGDLACK